MNTSIPELAHTLRWSDGADVSIEGSVDRFAATSDSRRLMMISCVMAAQDAKAFRAALSLELGHPMLIQTAIGFGLAQGAYRCFASPHGYTFGAHKLGFGMVHAVAVCREAGFMVEDSDEALWRELKSPRFTTPLLRSWLPFIRAQLVGREKLVPSVNRDCNCCLLTVTEKELDSIVESGIKKKKLRIER